LSKRYLVPRLLYRHLVVDRNEGKFQRRH
jgi:hypothetical protein